MRVCFVTIDFHSKEGGGGIGSYLSCLSDQLLRTGHKVSIVCGGKKSAPDFENIRGVNIFRVYLGNLHYYLSKIPLVNYVFTLPVRELEWSYALWKKVREINQKEHFDIIESCEAGNLFSILFPHSCPWTIRAHGARYSFKKYSGESIGPSEKVDRMLQRYCMARASALSAPSQFQARQIEKEIKYRQQVVPIPNPVDLRFFNDNFVSSHNSSKEKKIILNTGRIEIRKGTLVLLEAMGHVLKELKNVELVIAGGRHVSVTRRMLDEALDSGGIRDHVRLIGHVEWSDIGEFYRGCDIYVVPSYYETFCISAVEAMAYAKPVIGAWGTALPEVVEDGKTGLLVPPGDDKGLAGAMLKLLNDDQLAKRMGEAGRQKALSQYQASSVAKRTLEFYKGVPAKV